MGLKTIDTNISIDFYNNRYIMVNAKQNDDNSRKIIITCYNQGELFQINKDMHSAYVRYRKSDGNGGLNSCEINDINRTVAVVLTKEMLSCEGICEVDLIIVEKGGAKLTPDTAEIIYFDNDAILSTMTFYINILAATIDNTVFEYSSEYNGLIDALKRADTEFKDVVTLAKSYSEGGTGRRTNEDTDNAKYYSVISKSYSQGNTGERDGEDIDNSKHYSEQSSISANASEKAKGLSEAAQGKAELNAVIAQSWAVGNTGKRDGEDIDNSKYYSDIAKDYYNKATEMNESTHKDMISVREEIMDIHEKCWEVYDMTQDFLDRIEETENQIIEISNHINNLYILKGTIEYEELLMIDTTEIEVGYTYNISDTFTTNEKFKKPNVECPAGTNVYYTSDGYWDCLTLVSPDTVVPSIDMATVSEMKNYLGI